MVPVVFGLKAARTSSNIHPFQYSFDMAKLGALNVQGIDIDEGGWLAVMSKTALNNSKFSSNDTLGMSTRYWTVECIHGWSGMTELKGYYKFRSIQKR